MIFNMSRHSWSRWTDLQ